MADEVWEIAPGKKLGPFSLGATVADVLLLLKKRTPCRAIEIVYCEDAPFAMAIVIDSPEDGVKFTFDAVTQLLIAIEVYAVNLVAMRYHSELVFGKDRSPTFLSIYQLFGPTYPGSFDATTSVYALGYPGASFLFPIPSQYKAMYATKDALPMELPNGATPAAIGFSIFGGSDSSAPEPPLPLKPLYFEEVVVRGAANEPPVLLFTKSKRTVHLGATPQDVASELGPPFSTYYKTVLEHATVTGEYFQNYPDLGLDLLFTPEHTVAKVILRTNVPGHSEFTAYSKCNFRLEQLSADPAFPTLTPQTSWSTIQSAMGLDAVFRPTVHDNGSAADPFGASFLYTLFPGCVLEVLQNGAIASVTLATLFRQR
ncbi:hypothetical protein SPRG_05204 [Saprolegnia parasitica CBS 223.65]|uniref:Uncharacterized protein n=1 Tax=Saprolegnia parasitica (strain CBS 223.65) TaxID=695850 RepID=A0A067CLC0_SAPPC|nr:hypothetical protein SPRG_05204 [Saprolegnia parasitica CBS 223.65]KDO30015.1 hypothetical protein SPRG_05204 [Saprolegnia parasitica CBS 223.65]|eukprot:XP_012199197.1 hypothetical protein SPRG_05204 [Saprolegnia parasitica CBS 223.65]